MTTTTNSPWDFGTVNPTKISSADGRRKYNRKVASPSENDADYYASMFLMVMAFIVIVLPAVSAILSNSLDQTSASGVVSVACVAVIALFAQKLYSDLKCEYFTKRTKLKLAVVYSTVIIMMMFNVIIYMTG